MERAAKRQRGGEEMERAAKRQRGGEETETEINAPEQAWYTGIIKEMPQDAAATKERMNPHDEQRE